MSGNIFLSRFLSTEEEGEEGFLLHEEMRGRKEKDGNRGEKGILAEGVAFTAAFALGTRTYFSASFSKISQPTYLHLRLHKTPRSPRFVSLAGLPFCLRSKGTDSPHTLGSEKFPGRGILMKVQTLLLIRGGSVFHSN